ncbi:MAG: NIL domain-containing protein [Planctomycetota bacterium]
MSIRKFFCTFPQQLISEPLITHTLGAEYGVRPNIRAASISESHAHVVVEIEGELDQITESVDYLKQRGVEVAEIKDGEELPKF